MNKRCITGLIGVLLGLGMSAQVLGYQLGPFKATPSIDLEMLTTDNLYNTRDRGKRSSSITLKPSLNLEAGVGNQGGSPVFSYSLKAEIDAGRFTSSSDDDYNDLTLGGGFTYNPTSRVKFDFDAGRSWGHTPRGTGRTEGGLGRPLAYDPDEFTRDEAGLTFTYGLPSAKGQLILTTDYMGLKYANNRVFTRRFDHRAIGGGATFKWKLGPKTTVLAEARYKDFDYDYTPAGIAELDSDEQRYFIGAEWQATYKTKGSLRVGRYEKDFHDSARQDLSGGAWEAELEWKPRSYSKVSLVTGRDTTETNGTGDVGLSDYYGIAWDHAWVERLSTKIEYQRVNDDYKGSAREDDTDIYGLSANYQMRRWLDIQAGYQRTDKDSDDNRFDFERNDLYVRASARF